MRLWCIGLAATFLIALSAGLHAAAIDARDESGQIVLRNARLTLKLDKARKGIVTSLVDNATGQDFIEPAAAKDLLAITYTLPGSTSSKPEWLSSSQATSVTYSVQRAANHAAATIAFRGIAGRKVAATCTASVAEGSDLVVWEARVAGTEALMLEEVHFPRVWLRAPLEGDGAADAFVAGITKGGVYRRPSQWRKNHGVVAAQPGPLCAQFGCYYSRRAGFYSATRDARGYPKVLEFRRRGRGMHWVWRRRAYHRLSPKPFELGYDVTMTTFGPATRGEPTDWRDAADVYKRWALKQPWCATRFADRADVPDWLKAGPGMVRFSRGWLAYPERVDAWLHEYWRRHFPAARLIVALWGWEREGSWVSPKYFPPYPSEEGFAQIVRAIKSVQGHAFPWPSGYYWNLTYRDKGDGTFEWDDTADFAKTAKPHALLKRDGTRLSYKLRWLRGGRNGVLCRGDAWTRGWLNHTMVKLAKRGCDMVQVDQVVGGRAPGSGNCFSKRHGHPPGPGLWDMEAFDDQLRTMLAECRRVQPQMTLSIEEPQELCNHRIHIQDYRDFRTTWRPRKPGHVPESIFGYLYHEFLPVFQSNPRAGSKLCLAYCLVTGQVPHVVPHWPIVPSPAVENGGFEEWKDNVPASWSHLPGYRGAVWRGRPYRDKGVKHSGESSMRLENVAETDVVQVSQNVPVGGNALALGQRYRVRVWYKVESMARDNRIGFCTLSGPQGTSGSWGIPLHRGAQDWTEGQVDVVIPDGARCLRIMNHVNGPCRLWIDDMRIEKVGDDGTCEPVMRTGRPGTHEFAVQWVKLFHGEGRPYLLLGQMLRPPKLIEPTTMDDSHKPFPPILLNAFRAPDASEAAVAVNVTDHAQRVRFTWRGRAWQLPMQPWEARLVRAR